VFTIPWKPCSRSRGIRNCGAGWKTFALNGATGEVRSRLFLADSKKFGSVDRDAYGNIFRSEYMVMFRNAPSLLMVVADHDHTANTDLALKAYEGALEPKRLVMVKGDHFDPYLGEFDRASRAAVEWFEGHL